MPVPTSIDQLSTVAANNYPSGTDAPSTLDDVQRAHASFIAKIRDEGGFVSGTRLVFAQTAAPIGWTQDVSDYAINRMLRVVPTAGGGVGGSHSPIINNVVPAHTHGFTTGTMSADHTHSIGDPGHSHVYNFGPVVGPYGTGGGAPTGPVSTNSSTTGIWTGGTSANHTHSGSTDNGSSQTNWQPRYIDMIICTKN